MKCSEINILEVPEKWTLTSGKDTVVVVIDSHINQKSKVFNSVISYETLHTDRGIGTSHCTSVCNIISAVAPLSKIVVIQALIETTGTIFGLERALEKACLYDFDVLNLSVSSSQTSPGIESLIKKISSKSIVVCSVPNNGRPYFPSKYPEVLSVSSFNNGSFNANLYADDRIAVSDSKIKKTGNSMATALVSGICLLSRSYDKTILKEDFIRQLHEI